MNSPLRHALESASIVPDSIYEVDESPPAIARVDAPLDLRQGEQPHKELPHRSTEKAQLHQSLLWAKRTIHKNTAAAKLRLAGMAAEADKLERCHTVFTIAQCTKCGTIQKFPNRCDLFFCAECQPRLASDRRRAVEWWTREVQQPKHVVLTVKNVPDFTKQHVLEFKAWFTKLRRSVFAKNWIGGFYAIEVTNEGSGWHLHLHALINARWIDKFQLSDKWQAVTNGMGRIVHVRDARGPEYLKEVTKYAAKGSQIAAWSAAEISQFVRAFQGVRTFGVFGDLYGKRTEFAEWFKAIRDAKPPCKCGACSLVFMSELTFLEKDLVAGPTQQSLPPPVVAHPEFPLMDQLRKVQAFL